jgi:hypothetical protein
MTNHAPTPWVVDRANVEGVDVVDGRGNLIFTNDFRGTPDEASSGMVESIIGEGIANAYRIVACVNACEGIPTEALECQTKKQITRTMIGLIEEMTLLMKAAIARVDLANKDGDPILSAWRESAEASVSKAWRLIPGLADKAPQMKADKPVPVRKDNGPIEAIIWRNRR